MSSLNNPNDPHYKPEGLWPTTYPHTSPMSPSISRFKGPKVTLTIPAELQYFEPEELKPLNPFITRVILTRISQRLSQGSWLLGGRPNQGSMKYRVNQEWVAEQLKIRPERREVEFVRMVYKWSFGKITMKDIKCYILHVDNEEDGETSYKRLFPSQFPAPTTVAAMSRPYDKFGVKILLFPDWSSTPEPPLLLHDIQDANPHLSTTDIKAYLAERVQAGHLRALCSSGSSATQTWVIEEKWAKWLRVEMDRKGWKERLGWGFDLPIGRSIKEWTEGGGGSLLLRALTPHSTDW